MTEGHDVSQEVLDAVSMERRLGGIETAGTRLKDTLSEFEARMVARLNDICGRQDKTNGRVAWLEKMIWGTLGVVGTLVVLIGADVVHLAK